MVLKEVRMVFTFGKIGNIAASTAINYQYTDVAVLKTAPVF